MGRSPCCSKDAGLNSGRWTPEEDLILSEYIRIHGEGGWRSLPHKAGLKRRGTSCRLRWLNYLRPDIKHGNISPHEEELIIKMHSLLGNRWSLIARRLPGRTDSEIKNYWNTHLIKRLTSQNQTLAKLHRKPKPSDSVLKAISAKPTAVTIEKGRNKYRGNSSSNHQDLKSTESFRIHEVDQLMTDDHSEAQNVVASEFPFMEMNEHSPSSSSTFVHWLLYLNGMSTPECNLLFSPCHSAKDFRIKDFERRPSYDLQRTSHLETNMEKDRSFTVGDLQGIEEIYDKSQQGDWVDELLSEFTEEWVIE